jgi:hypothetical protein
MGFIMQAAEAAVADMLVDFSKRQELAPVRTANLASLTCFVCEFPAALPPLPCTPSSHAVRACAVTVQVDTVTAEEFMDDGTPIKLAITIDRAARTALLDFTGAHANAIMIAPI